MVKKPKARAKAATPADPDLPSFVVEQVAISSLIPHPRNYRSHPEDQIAHIVASLRQNGYYRNVVVARDGTILAGHGVVQAASSIGMTSVPVVRLPLSPDDSLALKILTGDNEVSHLGEIDDRQLSELLREVSDSDLGLLGTGYDDMMLANLAFVTRGRGEIADFNEAAEWAGMPDYDPGQQLYRLVVRFRSREDIDRFIKEKDISVTQTTKDGHQASSWWPSQEKGDLKSLRWEGGPSEGEGRQ